MSSHQGAGKVEQDDKRVQKKTPSASHVALNQNQTIHPSALQQIIQNPPVARPETVLQLQRIVGNRAAGQFIAQRQPSGNATATRIQRVKLEKHVMSEEEEDFLGETVKQAGIGGVCTALTIDWFERIRNRGVDLEKNTRLENINYLIDEQKKYYEIAKEHPMDAMEEYGKGKGFNIERIPGEEGWGKIYPDIGDYTECEFEDFVYDNFYILELGHPVGGADRGHVIGLYYTKAGFWVRDQNVGQVQVSDLNQLLAKCADIIEKENLPWRRWRLYKAGPGAEGTNKCCFVTTACVEARGLPDDCEELTTLRRFRDEYMRSTPMGEALIALYYNVAPEIVAAIEAQDNAPGVWDHLYSVIQLCIEHVRNSRNEKALAIYMEMVAELTRQYCPHLFPKRKGRVADFRASTFHAWGWTRP